MCKLTDRKPSAARIEDTLNAFIPQPPPPSPLPPRLPGAERQRLRTETSATSGWAARLAAKFPDRSVGSGRASTATTHKV